jgi:S1-C subfamily serine protease
MKIRYRFLQVVLMALLFLWSLTGSAFAQRKVLSSLEEDITSLVESIEPSLVTIETESYSRPLDKMKKLDIPPTLVGSGIIYTSDGYVLTTASVVGGMEKFRVTLPQGKVVQGKLVGTDDQSNVAVLKVEAEGLAPARLGNSGKVKVGSWLTVVGNSFGLPNAVALGLVNGLREDGFIQMSANVSPGNSGGPVLDTYGEVIGLVSAKLSEPSYINAISVYEDKSGKQVFTIPPRQIELPSSGVSLALPINRVKVIADDIIQHGTVERGYLGIYPEDLDEDILGEYDIDGGVLVSEVVEESPAENAGLLEDDILLEFEGKELQDAKELRYLILQAKPKQKVRITTLRDGREIELTAVLGRAKPQYGHFSDYVVPEPPDFSTAPIEVPKSVNWPEWRNESYDQLRRELAKLQQEMRKLSQELERLRQEDSDE